MRRRAPGRGKPQSLGLALRAAHERTRQRAKEGQILPQRMGIPRAGARVPKNLSEPIQEPAFLAQAGRLEAWTERSEPPLLLHREP
ncbi:hypothetical protein KSC_040270 [Ktedonobacter sp. SOSP1-52]|nr:hypothetical protein KSC_040270 [Ktedonobacter sp. SOSP1-52]